LGTGNQRKIDCISQCNINNRDKSIAYVSIMVWHANADDMSVLRYCPGRSRKE
jgi:hypothetical protein